MLKTHVAMVKPSCFLLLPVILAFLVLLLFFVSLIHAQGPVIFDESISPNSLHRDEEGIVTITGKNFTEPINVKLWLDESVYRATLTATLVSSSEIHVHVPGLLANDYLLEVKSGEYPKVWDLFVIFPMPDITLVEPSEFWNKNSIELRITGTNISRFRSATLGDTTLELSEMITPTSMALKVPASFEGGEHGLVLSFSGGTHRELIVVRNYITPEIPSIDNRIVYNNEPRTLEMSGAGLDALSSTLLLGEELESSNFRTRIKIPQAITTGIHSLVLIYQHGEILTITDAITVYPPIEATIDAITMNYNRAISDELIISGTNVASFTSASLIGGTQGPIPLSRLDKLDSEQSNQSLPLFMPQDIGMDDETAPSDEEYVLRLEFPDGTNVQKGGVFIRRPLLPVSGVSGWFWLLGVLGGVGVGAGWVYNNTLKNTNLERYESNKTSPEFGISYGFIAGTLGILIVWGLLIALIWFNQVSLSGGRIRFLSVWLLTGFALALTWQFYHWNTTFLDFLPNSTEILPINTRFIIVMVLSIVVFSLPFLFNNPRLIRVAPWILFVVPIVIVALGNRGYRWIQSKLEEERRKGPSDEVMLDEVKRKLYLQGQVSYTEDFPDYPRDRVENIFAAYARQNRTVQGVGYETIGSRLSFRRNEEVRAFNECFTQLDELLFNRASPVGIKEAADNLLEAIRVQMQFRPGEAFDLKQMSGEFMVYSYESRDLESILPTPFPFILFLSRSTITQAQIESLKQILNQIATRRRFALILPLGNVDSAKRIIQEELGKLSARENTIIFGKEDWLNILIGTQDLSRGFMDVVKAQLVDLTILSPYQVKGPTNTDMCFGRNLQISRIAEIINENSVAILGARRSGKTSMLHKIRHVLEERNYLLLYLDCYSVNDYETFFKGMAGAWEAQLSGLDWNLYKDKQDFSALVYDIKKQMPDKNLVFQFDEIDRLLNFDAHPTRDELLFRRLRSLSQQHECQFIFSGERTIMARLSDPKSGFFNFTIRVQLELLSRENADQLIKEPMDLVGVTLRDSKQILDLIFEYTEGHPNLIQSVCDGFLRELKPSQDRVVTPDIVRQTISSAKFDEMSFGDAYVEVFESQTTPMEQAMVILVCALGPLGEREFRAKLHEAGFEVTQKQIKQGLEYLQLCHLFTNNNGKYEINLSKFVEYKAIETDFIQDELADLLTEMKSNSKTSNN